MILIIQQHSQTAQHSVNNLLVGGMVVGKIKPGKRKQKKRRKKKEYVTLAADFLSFFLFIAWPFALFSKSQFLSFNLVSLSRYLDALGGQATFLAKATRSMAMRMSSPIAGFSVCPSPEADTIRDGT